MLSLVSPATEASKVDVEDSIDLLRRYGLRVPVIRREPGGEELGWPFDESQLREFLGADT
jgi:hypothetical protein